MSVSRQMRVRSGSVLMEYVMLTTVVLLALMGASSVFVVPGGAPLAGGAAFSGTGVLDYDRAQIEAGEARYDFGLLGNAFVDWYRRLATGLALPFP